MGRVKIKVEGSIDKALRQFKKRCIDSGIFMDIKRTAFYEKPSEERRREALNREKTIHNLERLKRKGLSLNPRGNPRGRKKGGLNRRGQKRTR